MKRAITTTALMVFLLAGSIRVTWIGHERLIDSIPYQDGSAVVIQQSETYYQFVFAGKDGTTTKESVSIPCVGEIERVLVRAAGRYVHLTVEGYCGVNLIRYELPDGARGLDGWYQNEIFFPVAVGGNE